MVFNSLSFVIFFAVVFFIYYFVLNGRTKWQNGLLLIASYFFYGFANWKMLPLMIAVSVIFYFLGFAIGRSRDEKRASFLTTAGVLLGVGILLYFKYFNFFIESFRQLLDAIGLSTNLHTFKIIMPLGISFFTFRLMSYLIEINRGHVEPEKDFVAFATYVSFFPCIMSGPIDGPSFISQLHADRPFDYDKAVDGCRQALWGLFKKLVIANNIASYIAATWRSLPDSSGSSLMVCAVFYSFQMYSDFSGYTDMAIGIGKLLGFRITDNFKYPFFAVNVADYWRRWHMSLTSWLTEYVFMPLNVRFRDLGNLGIILAIMLNMLVVGMWHGANWTFAFFGLYHGLLFIPLILTGAFYKKAKIKTVKYGLPCLKDFGRMVLTFSLVTIGLVIFRAESIEQAWQFLGGMFSSSLFSAPDIDKRIVLLGCFILLLVVVEWNQRRKPHALDLSGVKSHVVKYAIYAVLFMFIMVFSTDSSEFIYFQF